MLARVSRIHRADGIARSHALGRLDIAEQAAAQAVVEDALQDELVFNRIAQLEQSLGRPLNGRLRPVGFSQDLSSCMSALAAATRMLRASLVSTSETQNVS